MGKALDLAEGIKLTAQYRDKPGYDCSAEHDVMYLHNTDKPMSREDIQKMIDFGFHQEDVGDSCTDYCVDDYDHEESWVFYT